MRKDKELATAAEGTASPSFKERKVPSHQRRVRRLAVSARRTIVSSVRRLFRKRNGRGSVSSHLDALANDRDEDQDLDHRNETDEKGLTLLTRGSKHFPLLGGIASVKLYDFDILIDAHNLSHHNHPNNKTPEKKGWRRKQRERMVSGSGRSSHEGMDSVLSSLFHLPITYSKSSKEQGIGGRGLPDAKIILYAARDLPLDDLRSELMRVLSSRLPASSESNGPKLVLDHLLSALSRESLSASALSASLSHIKSGKSLEFQRTDCGGQEEGEPSACRITLSEGGGKQLSEVRSSELSFALFDLFLGENAVSDKARRMAALQLMKIQDRNARNAISLRPPPS